MYSLPMLAILAFAAGVPPATSKPAAAAAVGWTKEVTVSKMDDSRTVILTRRANQTVQGWPGKIVTPRLLLRCKEGGLEAYVATGMAPAVEYGDSDGATVLVRFDKEPAEELHTGKSTDGEALFFHDAKKMIVTMAAHERMLFRFTPFNSSPQETAFTLRGLGAVLKPLQEACGWDPEKERLQAEAAEAERQRAEETRAKEWEAREQKEAAAAAEFKARQDAEAQRLAAERAAELEASRPKRLADETKRLPELLYDLQKGDRPTVRMTAAIQIRSLQELRQQAIPGLLNALKDKDSGVRLVTIQALGAFGHDAALALPQLEQLASDPAPEVQEAARAAIAKIKP